MTKTAALDYAKHGIHVNAVCPSCKFLLDYTTSNISNNIQIIGADTALVNRFLHEGKQLGPLTAQHPWERLVRLTDITGPAIFLASDEAAFITGQLLTVDGGLTIA